MLLFGPFVTVAAMAVAVCFGRRPEREMAALCGIVLLVSVVLQVVLGTATQLPAALADVLLLGGCILLAVRHRRSWLYGEAVIAVAMMAVQVLCPDPLDPTPGFRALVNGLNLVALSLLLIATAMRGRARAGRAAPRLTA